MLKEFKSIHHPEQSHAQGWKESFVFRNLKSPTSPKWHLEGLTQKTPKNKRNESFAPAFAAGTLEQERVFFYVALQQQKREGKAELRPLNLASGLGLRAQPSCRPLGATRWARPGH